MLCDKAQDAIMKHVEKRLRPLQALALHRHIAHCEPCQELFLEMDSEITMVETPEGFVKAVMDKIAAVEVVTYKKCVTTENNPWDWVRLVGCLYALFISIGFAVFYNPDWTGMSLANIFFTGMTNITQWLDYVVNRINQAAPLHTVSSFGNYILAIALILTATLVYTVHREQRSKA